MVPMFEWGVSVLLVLYFAHERFNTPEHNRSSTTWVKFQVVQAAYVASALILFGALAGLAASSPQLVAMVLGVDKLPDSVATVSGPLAAALIMTTLLPRAPILSGVDAKLLAFFRDVGEIPAAVRRLADTLERRTLVIGDESCRRMVEHLESRDGAGQGVTTLDLDIEGARKLQHRFTRLLHLYLALDAWRTERRYAAFRIANAQSFTAAEKAVADVLDLADKLFPLYRELDGATLPTPISQSLKDLKQSFVKQFQATHAQVAELAARAILRCETSEGERRRRLALLGLAEKDIPSEMLPVNRLVMVMAMIFIVYFVGIIGLSQFARNLGLPIPRLFMVSTVSALCFGAAVVAALAPKRHGRFGVRDEQSVRPIIAYLLSGLVAALATALIGWAYRSALMKDPVAAFFDLQYSYPWYAAFAAVAFLTAWLCDNRAEPGARIKTGLQWRLLEGGAAALVMTGIAGLAGEAVSSIPDIPAGRVYPFWFVAPLWAAAGAVIGFWIPHWYRRACHVAPAPEPRAKPVAGVPPASAIPFKAA